LVLSTAFFEWTLIEGQKKRQKMRIAYFENPTVGSDQRIGLGGV
jgi:hypothetical protein